MAGQVDGNYLGSFVAGGTIPAHVRVKLSGGKIAIAGDAEDADEIGTSRCYAELDQPLSVRLATAAGTVKVMAGAAITAGDQIESAASGKVITKAAGALWGIALTAASGDGSIIEAIRK